MTGRRRAWVAVVLAVVAGVTGAGRADAAIYWNDAGAVARSNNDGSLFSQVFIERNRGSSPVPSGQSETSGCDGIAVDGSHVYWADQAHGTIDRADLDGGNVDYEFITGLAHPCGVAVDGSNVYWADGLAGTIGKADLGGGEVQREFIAGVGSPCGVALGGGYLYWTGYVAGSEAEERGEDPGDYVARVPVGGGVRQKIFSGGDGLCGVAVDATHAYFGGFGWTIGRVGLDGSDPEPSFIAGVYRPAGVALFGAQIYWTRSDFQDRGISTASLADPGASRSVVGDPMGVPDGLAIDSVQIPPPLPPPPPPVGQPLSHVVTFGPPRHGEGAGVTFVTVAFPQAGVFTAKGSPGVRVRVFPHGPSKRTRKLLAPEERLLKVWPASGGRAAKALRTKLRERGAAEVWLRIHFYAADHTSSAQRKRLSLLGRRTPRGVHRGGGPQARGWSS